jgi:hypothetical protein
MSFNPYVAPLRLDIKPSRLLKKYLVCLHGLAWATIFIANGIPDMVVLLFSVILIISLKYYLTTWYSKYHASLENWNWQSDGSWINDKEIWELSERNIITPWYVVVYLSRYNGASQNLLIIRDQLSDHAYLGFPCAQARIRS